MVKTNCNFIFYLGLVLILSTSGCKVKTDIGYPEITVLEPTPNAIFNNGDTIRFIAKFIDNSKLNNIELILVNEANKPVLPMVSITPNKNPYTFQGDYVISDPMLPGGQYYLNFKAYNEENLTNKFIEIQISDLAKEMLYPIIVTHPGTDKWDAYRLTSANVWHNFFSNTGDYSGCAINPAESQFYMCGNSISNLTSVKLPEGLIKWNIKPVYHQSQRWFEGIESSYPNLYVSCAEGNIRGYNKEGSEVYKSETFPNAEPHHLTTTNNFIVGEFVDAYSNDRFLVTFHNPGGKMFSSKFYDGNVIALLHSSLEKVLVLCNKDDEACIMQYDATYNSLSNLHSFYEGIFIAAAKMDNDNYLISSSVGVYHYRISNNSLILFISGIKDAKIAFDDTSQQFYICSGKEMSIYSFPNPVLLNKIQLPDTIVDFHLVFNK
jgi:hypothetical protein